MPFVARQICDEALHMHLPSDPPEMPLLTGHASCCFELGMHRNAPSAEQDFQNLCSSKTLSSLMYCMYFYNPIVSEIFSVRRIARELFSKFPPYWKPVSCGFPKSWRSKIKLLVIKFLDRDIRGDRESLPSLPRFSTAMHLCYTPSHSILPV